MTAATVRPAPRSRSPTRWGRLCRNAVELHGRACDRTRPERVPSRAAARRGPDYDFARLLEPVRRGFRRTDGRAGARARAHGRYWHGGFPGGAVWPSKALRRPPAPPVRLRRPAGGFQEDRGQRGRHHGRSVPRRPASRSAARRSLAFLRTATSEPRTREGNQ